MAATSAERLLHLQVSSMAAYAAAGGRAEAQQLREIALHFRRREAYHLGRVEQLEAHINGERLAPWWRRRE